MAEHSVAVFLDRDGTVCEEMGYINHISRCRLFSFAAEAIRKVNQAGAKVVIVSNQSGVAQGYFPESLVREVNEYIVTELKGQGAQVDAIYFCPHHPEARITKYRRACDCRKPHRGMLDWAVRDLQVDLSRSYMIGDRRSDIEVGALHGLRSILVLTGYGRGEWEHHRKEWRFSPDWVCEDLREAVDQVLFHMNQRGSDDRANA